MSNQIDNLLSDRVMSTREIVCLSVVSSPDNNLHKPGPKVCSTQLGMPTLASVGYVVLQRRQQQPQQSPQQQQEKSHKPNRSILLARNQLLRVEQLAICSSAHLGVGVAFAETNPISPESRHLIHNCRLQIDLRCTLADVHMQRPQGEKGKMKCAIQSN